MKVLPKITILILVLAVYACSPARKVVTENETKSTPKEIAPVKYQASATISHDLINTSLNVTPDWKNKKLIGSATITLKPHFYATNMLYLDARGMDINEVKLVNGDKYDELAYVYRNDSICITLDKTYSSRDTFTVFIDYVSKPEELPVGGSSAITSDKGLYFINADGSDPVKPQQVWTQGETQASSVWFPTIDRPNQKSTQEIYITVDTAFVTLSNGKLVSSIVNSSNGTRTDYWKQSLPHAPYLFMFAVGKFAVVKDSWRGKEVSYYVEPEFEKYARNIFGNTPEMIEYFTKILGVDYAWDKYSSIVVRDYVSGAMENTTATVFGEFMQNDDRGLLDGSNEETISHELFHQWFGDLVTCESWSNLPLNESFATYGEYLWNEHKYGRDEADYAFQNDLSSYLREARNKQVNLIRFSYESQENMFDSHSYSKGGRVLNMLRRYTGDSAFFASLKLYLDQNRFKSVEIHNLRLAFESVTGEDLNWFFNQWFLDKGHPILKIDYSYDAEAGKERMTVQQVQNFETSPLYRLPVEVDFYLSSGITKKKIIVTRTSETFEFDMSEKPVLVNFDAQKMLLCSKVDNHTPEEWIAMYKQGPLYMDRFEALTKIIKSYSAGTPESGIVEQALNDKHWNLRMLAVKNCKPILTADRMGIKQKLMSIAVNDPKSNVRHEALVTLSESFSKDSEVNQLMRKAVNDSSYVVMETAITHILDDNHEEGLNLIKNLEKDSNENIKAMVAGLYKEYGNDDQFEFMTKVMMEANGYSKYNAVQIYGKYLLRCGPENANKGIDQIATVGNSYPQWIVRLSAVQTLSEIAKSYGKSSTSGEQSTSTTGNTVLNERQEIENGLIRKRADEIVTEIKSKEKDLNLVKIYHKAP